MIISNSRQFIFVHIHKTAGTAITKELESSIAWNDLSITGSSSGNVKEHWYKTRFALEMHSPANAIRNVVGDEVWQNYYTFAFVRDPYRRILSLYTWLDGLVKARGIKGFERYIWPQKGIWDWPGTKAYVATSNFSEFLRHPLVETGSPGALPMVESLYEDNELLVDFVGKQESLDQDIATIRSKVGLSGASVPRTNATASKVEPKNYYASQADLDLVYERYRADFEAFGYKQLEYSEM